MNKKHCKVIASIILVAVVICAMAYAGKDSKDEDLSLDQVPAAVKATILKEAQGGEVEEIELEDENGENLYEAKVVIDGQEYELKIKEGTFDLDPPYDEILKTYREARKKFEEIGWMEESMKLISTMVIFKC